MYLYIYLDICKVKIKHIYHLSYCISNNVNDNNDDIITMILIIIIIILVLVLAFYI